MAMRPDTAVLNPSLPALWTGVAPAFLNLGTRRTLSVYPDDSGYLNDGTPTGWANQAAFNGAFSSESAINRYALDFTGGEYIEASIARPNVSTFCAWAKLTAASLSDIFAIFGQDNGNSIVGVWYGYPAAYYGNPEMAVSPISLDAWYHFAFINTAANNVDIYVNGVGPASVTGTVSYWMGLTQIGASGGSYKWRGKLADLAVFPLALSGSQVAALADASDPSCGGLIQLTSTPPANVYNDIIIGNAGVAGMYLDRIGASDRLVGGLSGIGAASDSARLADRVLGEMVGVGSVSDLTRRADTLVGGMQAIAQNTGRLTAVDILKSSSDLSGIALDKSIRYDIMGAFATGIGTILDYSVRSDHTTGLVQVTAHTRDVTTLLDLCRAEALALGSLREPVLVKHTVQTIYCEQLLMRG